MLDHRYPAAGKLFLERFVREVVEVELGEAFIWLRQRDTKERLHGHGIGIGRGRQLTVAFDLPEEVALPAGVTLVVDEVFYVDKVVTLVQGKALGDFHLAVRDPFQVNLQRVLSGSEFEALAASFKLGTTFFIDTVGPYQPALGDVGEIVVAFQQYKGNVRVILPGQVLWQGKFNDVATVEVDRQLQDIGMYLHDSAGRLHGRLVAGLLCYIRCLGNILIRGCLWGRCRCLWQVGHIPVADQAGCLLHGGFGMGVFERNPFRQQHERKYSDGAYKQ